MKHRRGGDVMSAERASDNPTIKTAPRQTEPEKPRGQSATSGRVLMSGVIEDESMVIDLLTFLSNGGRTAGFDVIEAHTRRTIYLRKGDIIAASSNLPGDRLGHVVFRMGLISAEQLAELLRQSGEGNKIGNILIAEGHITPKQLWAAMRAQTEEILASMVEVKSGRFLVQRFEAALLPNLNPMGTQQLLLDVLRRQDELAHLRTSLPDALRPLMLTDTPHTPASPETAQIEGRLLASVDNRRTLTDLVQVTGLGELRVLRAVQHLLKTGVLAVGEAQAPAVSWSADVLEGLMALVARYNQAYGEVGRHFLNHISPDELARVSSSFFEGCSGEDAILFADVHPGAEARLPLAPLVSHLKQLDPPDPEGRLRDGLHEYLQFLLFLAWEHLDPTAVDQLIHRTELIIRES
ncbi:MAG: DUF4388 domain-containing protein [Bradymonadia bacterium]